MRTLLFTLVAIFTLTGCADKDHEAELYFMGDSLIELWDIEDDFPTRITHNWGLAGSGIYYLQSLPKVPAEDIVIVISGTNELRPERNKEEWDEYIDLYLKTISERGGDYIILLPVFPTEKEWQKNIPTMNRLVKERVNGFQNVTYLDIYDLFEKDGSIHQEYTTDGLHLSRQAYDVIASKIYEIIK